MSKIKNTKAKRLARLWPESEHDATRSDWIGFVCDMHRCNLFRSPLQASLFVVISQKWFLSVRRLFGLLGSDAIKCERIIFHTQKCVSVYIQRSKVWGEILFSGTKWLRSKLESQLSGQLRHNLIANIHSLNSSSDAGDRNSQHLVKIIWIFFSSIRKD